MVVDKRANAHAFVGQLQKTIYDSLKSALDKGVDVAEGTKMVVFRSFTELDKMLYANRVNFSFVDAYENGIEKLNKLERDLARETKPFEDKVKATLKEFEGKVMTPEIKGNLMKAALVIATLAVGLFMYKINSAIGVTAEAISAPAGAILQFVGKTAATLPGSMLIGIYGEVAIELNKKWFEEIDKSVERGDPQFPPELVKDFTDACYKRYEILKETLKSFKHEVDKIATRGQDWLAGK